MIIYSGKKIAVYMTMMREEKRLANLDVVYMKDNILARQYDSVKWYWYSEVKYHWESESKTCHY